MAHNVVDTSGSGGPHAVSCGLDTCDAIDGVESRIGANNGNPSYSYCLPEDTEQLPANHKDAPGA